MTRIEKNHEIVGKTLEDSIVSSFLSPGASVILLDGDLDRSTGRVEFIDVEIYSEKNEFRISTQMQRSQRDSDVFLPLDGCESCFSRSPEWLSVELDRRSIDEESLVQSVFSRIRSACRSGNASHLSAAFEPLVDEA